MKFKSVLILFLTFPFLTFAEEEINQDQLSETLGHLFVRGLGQSGFEFNYDKVIEGIRNELNGLASPMTEEEYEQVVYTIQEQQFTKTAELNLAQANAFLEENATQEGIKSINSQLQFKVIQAGAGEKCVSHNSVPLIHYKGSLIDGTTFASSQEAGEPVALPLQQSIPGLAQGLEGMLEGEKRILYMHPELAQGLSAQLPPNALLIFEVEVVNTNAVPIEEETAVH